MEANAEEEKRSRKKYVSNFLNNLKHYFCMVNGERPDGWYEGDDFDLETVEGNKYPIDTFLNNIGNVKEIEPLRDPDTAELNSDLDESLVYELSYKGGKIHIELRDTRYKRSQAQIEFERASIESGNRYFLVNGMVDLLDQFLASFNDHKNSFLIGHFWGDH